jgi:hypothetical protein
MKLKSNVASMFDHRMAWLAAGERVSEQFYRAAGASVGNLTALTRGDLHELEAIEGLASFLSADRFGALALQFACEYPVKIDEPYQSIPKQQHSSVIGMSDAPFEVLRVVCEVVISRVPELLRVPSYRHRHESRTTISHGLWVALLERANGDIFLVDPVRSHASDGRSPADTVTPFQDW